MNGHRLQRTSSGGSPDGAGAGVPRLQRSATARLSASSWGVSSLRGSPTAGSPTALYPGNEDSFRSSTSDTWRSSMLGFVTARNSGSLKFGKKPRLSDTGDAWDMLKRKSHISGSRFGGLPLVGPNSGQRRSSARKSMMKRNIMKMEKSFTPAWKTAILNIIDGTKGTIFLLIVTVWALFGDDIRLIAFAEPDDGIFLILVYLCMAIFTLEMILGSIAKQGYLNSFYFWLDMVATLSFLMDIPDLLTAIGISPCHSEDPYGATFYAQDQEEEQDYGEGGGGNAAVTDGAFARAGRASRAGTRAGRIVRVVRLVRIVKLYKAWQMARNRANAKKLNNLVTDDDALDATQATRVGQRLSDLTTRRVIIGVLSMLFCLPLFDINTFPQGDEAVLSEGGLKMVHKMLIANGKESPGFYSAVEDYVDNTAGMYVLVINGTRFENHSRMQFTLNGESHRVLRCTEYAFAAYETPRSLGGSRLSFAFFDISHQSRLQALLNMMRTIFVCIVLGMGAMLFSKDANELVLKPIERMVWKVREVSENPLTRFEVQDDDGKDEQLETKLLENSIAKICGLLAVGFGEAGSAVIAENMKRGGEINPMIPGKKIVAIFGFCDIRQFTDTTEVLQEGVMEFVNTIGKIVHMEVHLHGGSANKNIGDAFLLVWKFPKDITLDDVQHPEKTTEDKRKRISIVANNALASFIVIMAGLRRSAKLNTYRKDPQIEKRMPNFEVKMGFGLHVGWAIEGAIGSEYKVDASYLSPNVNMSARLEAATKQFGVPLLVSEDFVNICSEGVRSQCRQIDRVTVKGSVQPMGIFTYDTNADQVPPPNPNTDPSTPAEAESNSFFDYEDEFAEHPDITQLRKGVTTEFLEEFKKGFKLYEAGEWDKAAEVLKTTSQGFRMKTTKGEPIVDGPSLSLLQVMEKHDFKAPANWRGYRELTEK